MIFLSPLELSEQLMWLSLNVMEVFLQLATDLLLSWYHSPLILRYAGLRVQVIIKSCQTTHYRPFVNGGNQTMRH